MTKGLLDSESELTVAEPIQEDIVATPAPILLEDLRDIVFKLRAFTESHDGDLGLGVELGMQRAADMIESVINRHRQSTQGE